MAAIQRKNLRGLKKLRAQERRSTCGDWVAPETEGTHLGFHDYLQQRRKRVHPSRTNERRESDFSLGGSERTPWQPVEKSLLAALLRETQTRNGCQLRFGLDFFSRLASKFFEQAARIDF
ncbi:hypothetical protein [Fundidesulfovibrio butyratiphilus]